MSLVELTRDGLVAVVKLNRPPVNALSEELAADLLDAFRQCEDPAVRAVVLTGGKIFAVGADIKRFKEQMDSGSDEEASATALAGSIDALEKLAKPTIAVVHGFALGGGLELAMGADFRYLADDAKVGQPEILLGLIPGAGGTQRLPRLVGYQTAKRLILSGDQVGAHEALQMGLADEVGPADSILESAMADAARMAGMATVAVGEAKRVLNSSGVNDRFSDGRDEEAKAFQRLFHTVDAKEGVAAFVEKRDAEFIGE